MAFTFANEFAERIYKLRYAFDENESWEAASRRVAAHVSKAEEPAKQSKFEEEFYEELSEGRFMPGGRIWYGAGRNKAQLINCFVLPSEDSREGWGDLLRNNLIISGTGGGVGINFSAVRPRGTAIVGTGGEATGSVSLMNIVNGVCEEIKAGGGRRSALMFCLNSDHPDILEFLNAKLDLGKINNANISIVFMNESPADFFEKVKADADHHLMWKGKIVRTIKARELWDILLKNALKNGEPGILNGHLANEQNNIAYCRDLISTNPCFPASERLLTDNGYQTFGALYGTQQNNFILSDNRVSYDDDGGPEKPENWKINTSNTGMTVRLASPVKLTQQNASILELKFSHGAILRCTPEHLIATSVGMIEAQHLTSKHEILASKPAPKQSIVGKTPKTLDEKAAFLMGMIAGDGTFAVRFDTGTEQACVDLWNVESSIENLVKKCIDDLYDADYEAGFVAHSNNSIKNTWANNSRKLSASTVVKVNKQDKTRIQSVWLANYLRNKYGFEKATKHQVPEFIFNNARNTSGQFYLAALFYCDGTINAKSSSDVRLAQSNEMFLRQIQMLLQANGILSKIYSRRKAQNRLMPDGKGSSKEYFTKENFELITSTDRVDFIKTIGFLGSYKEINAKNSEFFMNPIKSSKRIVNLISANHLNQKEDVFCLQELVARNITVSTLVAKRCGEIFMQAYSVCCLGAVVLPRFVKDSKAKNINDRFDWGALHTSVGRGIRFLDNVLTVNHYPIPETEVESKKTRRVGLGIMGLHDMLLMLGLKYSSQEGRDFVSKVMSFIKHAAYDTSTYLALEKGAFPEFNAEKFLKSGFVKNLKPSVRNKIRDYGMRNCAVLTIAPTGTTSIVQGVTSGIEPIFAPAYNRRFKDSNLKLHSEVVVHPLFEQFVNDGLDVSHFEGSDDVAPREHFLMQAVCQEHVDNAISKTVNIPQEKYTPELLSELYMEFVPQLKGTTIYPVGSRQDTPLEAIPLKEAYELVVAGKAKHEEEAIDNCVSGVCGL